MYTTYDNLTDIRAGVPQGSVLDPMSHLLYINYMPKTFNTTLTIFTDDIAVNANTSQCNRIIKTENSGTMRANIS